MSKLRRVSGSEVVAALGKIGFYVRRQRGSRIFLRRDEPLAQTTVQNHRELDSGTLRAIFRQIGLSAACAADRVAEALPRTVAGLMATGTCHEVGQTYAKLD